MALTIHTHEFNEIMARLDRMEASNKESFESIGQGMDRLDTRMDALENGLQDNVSEILGIGDIEGRRLTRFAPDGAKVGRRSLSMGRRKPPSISIHKRRKTMNAEDKDMRQIGPGLIAPIIGAIGEVDRQPSSSTREMG